MKNVLMAVLLVFTMTYAEDYKAITWSDLKGKVEAYDDPFKKLTSDQLYNLSIYAKISEMQKEVPDRVSDSSREQAIEAEKKLIHEGVDIQALLAQREHIKNLREAAAYKANADLNNTDISISGYILNLSLNRQGKMQEFLLVPILIKCFHEPTPPPNQIAYVKMKTPFEPVSHFTPMTIKGRILTQKSSNELFLVDEGGIINSSYAIYADSVEKYLK